MRTPHSSYKRILLFILALFCGNILLTHAQEMAEVEEYVLEFKSKSGALLLDGSIAIRVKDRWLYAVEDITEAMGFYINGSIETGIYEGYVRDESRTYLINGDKCLLSLENKESKVPCEKFQRYDGTWYMDEDLFKEIFKVNFVPVLNKSRIIIESQTPLPKEMQRQKKDLDEVSGKQREKLPLETTPYEWVDGFNLYQRAQNNNSKNGQTGRTHNTFDHALYLRSELANMSLKANVTGVDGKYDPDWLSLSRRDPHNAEDNQMQPSFFEVGNLQSYTTPYLASSGKVYGFNINNRDLDRTTNFMTQDFQGDLRTGWFLELYRNDTLMATAEPDENQRYLIQGIPLLLGTNRIHIIFYGPFGNIEHKYETIVINEYMLSSKNMEYNVALGRTEEGTPDIYLNTDARINKRTLLSLYYKEDDMSRFQGDIKGLLFNSGYTLSHAQSQEGSLQGLTLQPYFRGTNIFSRFTNYNGFRVFGRPDKELARDSFISANTSFFRGIMVGLDHTHEIDIHERTNNEFRNRIGFGRSNFYFGNTLSIDKDFTRGEAFIRFSQNRMTHRLSNSYEDKRSSKKIQWQSSYNQQKNRYRLSLDRNFDPDIDTLLVSTEKDFKHFLAFASVSANSQNDFGVILGIGSLLSYDMKTNYLETRSERNVETSQVVVRPFLDLNENNVMDEGDVPLTNIEFRNGQNRDIAKSNDQGNARFTGLYPWKRVRLEVVMTKLPNIYYRPSEPAKEIYLRGGKTSHVDFPFIVQAEVYGEISGAKYPKDLLVHLVKGEEILMITKPDSEGYYLLEEIKMSKELQLKLYDPTRGKYLQSKEVSFESYENPEAEVNFEL